MKTDEDRAREKAILQKACKAVGGQAKLAGLLAEITGNPVQQGHISNWMRLYKDPMPPAIYAIAIERATKGIVKRHEVRPDLYPIEKPDVYRVKYPHRAKTLDKYIARLKKKGELII